MKTKQTEFWSGDFGKDYTDRNPQTVDGLNTLDKKRFGFTREEINQEFLGELDKNIRILEVGCNIGVQLMTLQKMGFTNLYGIELQPYAVEEARKNTKGINIIQGNGFDIPFKDGFFDLVYTSGVLIHIAPSDLPKITKEMLRTSKQYIWGFEYYAPEVTDIPYRGNTGFLWKADYAGFFLAEDKTLQVSKQKKYDYITEKEKGNTDNMYLLEKK